MTRHTPLTVPPALGPIGERCDEGTSRRRATKEQLCEYVCVERDVSL